MFQDIDKARKQAGRDTWWQYVSPCGRVQIKGWNTWLQILRIDGLSHWAPADCTVKAYRDNLGAVLRRAGLEA